MKIAYVAYASVSDFTGVWEKVQGQSQALNALGNQVQLFLIDHGKASVGCDDPHIAVIQPEVSSCGTLSRVVSEVRAVRLLGPQLREFVPDIIFLRYPLYRPGLGRVLGSVAPFVIEINGNPLGELFKSGKRLESIVERHLGRYLLARASGFVGVTEESILYAAGVRRRGQVPVTIIGNGVDCRKTPFLSHRYASGIHVAYVGSRSTYSGIDRLIRAMRQSEWATEDVGVHLHVVGRYWDEEPGLEDLIRRGNATNHGYVTGRELDEILARTDLCLGPLAVHRKGLREGTPLKVRRYLAHGIPVVIGYRDTDIVGDYGFVLRVPSDDSPIDLTALIEFAKRIREHPEIRLQARVYAENKLDYAVKVKQLMGFFEHVIRNDQGKQLPRVSR